MITCQEIQQYANYSDQELTANEKKNSWQSTTRPSKQLHKCMCACIGVTVISKESSYLASIGQASAYGGGPPSQRSPITKSGI